MEYQAEALDLRVKKPIDTSKSILVKEVPLVSMTKISIGDDKSNQNLLDYVQDAIGDDKSNQNLLDYVQDAIGDDKSNQNLLDYVQDDNRIGEVNDKSKDKERQSNPQVIVALKDNESNKPNDEDSNSIVKLTVSKIVLEDKENQFDEEVSDVPPGDEDDNCYSDVEDTEGSIKWISSQEYFTIPQYIWNEIIVGGKLHKTQYTFYKNKIGQIFDKIWKCIFIITHFNVGKTRITFRGHCKHSRCRRYNLICYRKDVVDLSQSPRFLVRYDKVPTKHKKLLARQLRGVLRRDAKVDLKRCKPATYTNDQLRTIDMDLYLNKNSNKIVSDSTIQKARSEMLNENNFSKDDFEDMVILQKKTKDDPYINKVVSPYAVYMHSKIQFTVLEAIHKRKSGDTEVVGHLDATGGVAKVTPETSVHPVLYYPLITRIKGDESDDKHTIFAVSECLNSSHKVPDVAAWLFDFNEAFMQHNSTILPIFDRIISDFAYANFHGVLHAFQGMRIHEYLFISYRFAVSLTDFGQLSKLVKIQMCCVHLTNTFAEFVRKYFPSKLDGKKTTFEQKYLIEVLCSLISCKSYNRIKEIFRNMCTLILSKRNTSHILVAKENIAELTTIDRLMEMPQEIKTIYQYDKLTQEDLTVISDCESSYDFNESILKLPIYRASLFYKDLREIYDNFVPQSLDVGEEDQEQNSFHNKQILLDFMKQFGGILPLWTGITVPKGINRYNNQPAESQMHITKDLLIEKSLELGSGKVKPTKFAKLMRTLVQANHVRFMLQIPRHGLNHGRVRKNKNNKKEKDKDYSKVNKKIVKHVRRKMLTKQIFQSPLSSTLPSHESSIVSVQSLNSTMESKISMESPTSSLQHAKEAWNKTAPKKQFTYFNKVTIASAIAKSTEQVPSKSVKKVQSTKSSRQTTAKNVRSKTTRKVVNVPSKSTKSAKKSLVGSTATNVNPTTSKSDKSATKSLAKSTQKDCNVTSSKESSRKIAVKEIRSETTEEQLDVKLFQPEEKFKNGLVKMVEYYLQLDNVWSYIVAKRTNGLLSTGDNRSDGLLAVKDYETLKSGQLSHAGMNYIIDFMLPQKYMNLTCFAEQIIAGVDCFEFSIHDKICFIAHFDHNQWVLYVINTKKSTFCYISTNINDDTASRKFQDFEKFISAYNSGNRRNKLKNLDCWKLVTLENNIVTEETWNSGIYVTHYVYQLATTGNLQDDTFDAVKFRKILLLEVLQYSEDMKDICLKCGKIDDSLNTNQISWTSCDMCQRWIHDSCLADICKTGNFKCPLCVEFVLEKLLCEDSLY